MALKIVSRLLKAFYGTDADTKVTHSFPCVENPDAENVSTTMDTVIIKNVFTDKDGNPIKDVTGKAVQKSHEFRFGANLFMLDELETKEKNDLYKKNCIFL